MHMSDTRSVTVIGECALGEDSELQFCARSLAQTARVDLATFYFTRASEPEFIGASLRPDLSPSRSCRSPAPVFSEAAPMLILLWGLPDEAPLAAVASALRDAGAPFALLDQRQVLATRVQLAVGHRVSGRITLRDLDIDMEEIAAAYIRPYESRLFTSVARARRPAAAQARASSVDELLLSWCDITPALVLNRPRHMGSNNSKPYQAQIIRKVGFRVPQTLITTSPVAAREFQQQHGSVIYKSISGIRSRVTRLTPARARTPAERRLLPHAVSGICARLRLPRPHCWFRRFCQPAALRRRRLPLPRR